MQSNKLSLKVRVWDVLYIWWRRDKRIETKGLGKTREAAAKLREERRAKRKWKSMRKRERREKGEGKR